jgi:hypothetical protein
MKCYIQIENGNPIGHPMVEENFVQCFPEIDLNNLPSNWANFVRVVQPEIDRFEVVVGVSYQWVDGVVKDVWEVRQITDEEKNTLIDSWRNKEYPDNYFFNEITYQWNPITTSSDTTSSGSAPNVVG